MTATADLTRAVDWDADPAGLDGIAADLRALRSAAGEPSYTEIVRRVVRARTERGVPAHERRIPRSTVYDCFRDGRRRVDADALAEIVLALGLPPQWTDRWSRRVRTAQTAATAASIASALDGAPEPVPYFSGRRAELDTVHRALQEPDARVWITGMAGSGKTQTVLAALARSRPGRPGGAGGAELQGLFIDLRGRPVDSAPVDPAAAQRAVLRAMGRPDTGSAAERARRLLTVLRETGRTLVLDDAVDDAQVGAILGAGLGVSLGAAPDSGTGEDAPDGPGRVVVTSRARPAAHAGWTLIRLEGMGPEEVAAVLHHFTRSTGAAAEAAERLTLVSGGLPLAVALVGGRVATHPEWTLAEHVELMEEGIASAHLDEELRGALTLSYADLPEDVARLLRTAADLPTADLGMAAAAAALEVSEDQAADLADTLVGRSLAVHSRPGRIALHALVRASGRSWARRTDPPRLRREAFGRVGMQAARRVWHAYAVIAHSMDDVPRKTGLDYPGAAVGYLDAEAAGRWLRGDLDTLLTLAHAAPGRDHPAVLFRLSEGLSWWMNLAGHHSEALRLHEAAADVAMAVGDADALAMASLDAGQLLVHRDRPEEALRHFRRATRLVSDAGELSDPGLLGVILNMTSLLEIRRGNLDHAVRDLRRAVDIHRDRGEPARHMSALVNLGVALEAAGRFDEEDGVIASGLDLARSHGHRMFMVHFLVNRATLRLSQGRPEEALADAVLGARQAEEVGIPYLVISADGSAALAALRSGDATGAQGYIDRAVAAAEVLGNDLTTAEQLVVAAEVASGRGRATAAMALLDRAAGLLAEGSDHLLRERIREYRGRLGPQEWTPTA